VLSVVPFTDPSFSRPANMSDHSSAAFQAS
jgi:hypothetical protein